MAKTGMDVFANIATISVTETAANTLTYKKLETGISITEKTAWLINRVAYFFGVATPSYFNASLDNLYFGLSVSNMFTTMASLSVQADPAVLDYNCIERVDYGTAASGLIIQQPVFRDFSTMPGGGIIVPPTPLYAYAQGESLTTAVTVLARLYFTTIALTVDQYWELVEARRVISS